MSQTKKNASKKKKKFNHTALYTDILSSRHSHLHVNNAPGSTAPPVTPGDPQIRPRLWAPVTAALVQPPSFPELLPAACSRRPRYGASVRRTRRVMLWLLILSFIFFLVRVNIFLFSFNLKYYITYTKNYIAAMCSTASCSPGASHYQTLRKPVNLWARLFRENPARHRSPASSLQAVSSQPGRGEGWPAPSSVSCMLPPPA